MSPDLQFASIAAYYGVFAFAIVFALWKGGEPERYGIVMLLVGFFVQATAYGVTKVRFESVDPASLLVDLVNLVGFTAIALNAKRYWPLVAAALQLLAVLTHFARFVELEITPLVYSVMRTLPTGGVIVLVIMGTAFHIVRLKRWADDPAWVDWEMVRGKSKA